MKLTTRLGKMQLLTMALQFKKNNTKQEYAPTNVGTNSLVLFDGLMGHSPVVTRWQHPP